MPFDDDVTILVGDLGESVYVVTVDGVNPFTANWTCTDAPGFLLMTITLSVLPVGSSAA